LQIADVRLQKEIAAAWCLSFLNLQSEICNKTTQPFSFRGDNQVKPEFKKR